MKYHFIGIGGIGLSGLARYSKYLGHNVRGSDIKKSPLTENLKKEGIDVFIPHSKDNISDDIDLVIHTAVAKRDNVEIQEAKRKNIKVISRREFLPYILKDKKVLSVCGAHGKSTTTAILASILDYSDAIIGAESKEFNSNVRFNNSDTLVFEADESDGSFIDTNPYLSIVINTEPEHMEYYNYDLDSFYNHYYNFLKKSQIRVANGDDEFIKKLDLDINRVYINDAKNIRFELRDNLPKTIFEYKNKEFEIYGFGEHLVLDALLAIESALYFVDIDTIVKNIKNFKGIKKRFDVLYKDEDFILIDDYAHHPTEIKATLKAAKHLASITQIDKVIAIWQPHKYSRTIDNLDAFIDCFDGVDELVILPVWSAGEEKRDIDFKKHFSKYNLIFADSITSNKNSIILNSETKKEYKKGLVIGFGAGDITYQLRGNK